MKLIKQNEIPNIDVTDGPLFYGGKVTRKPIVDSPMTTQYTFALVSFSDGAKNHFHTHTSDQILFATQGSGIVANEAEELLMNPGDTAFIPAGEKHWHGASNGHDFVHVSLTRPDSTTEMFLP